MVFWQDWSAWYQLLWWISVACGRETAKRIVLYHSLGGNVGLLSGQMQTWWDTQQQGEFISLKTLNVYQQCGDCRIFLALLQCGTIPLFHR